MTNLNDIKGFDVHALANLYRVWGTSGYTKNEVRNAVCELNASIVHVPRRNCHELVNKIQSNTRLLLKSKGIDYTINAFINNLGIACECGYFELFVESCIPLIAFKIRFEEFRKNKENEENESNNAD